VKERGVSEKNCTVIFVGRAGREAMIPKEDAAIAVIWAAPEETAAGCMSFCALAEPFRLLLRLRGILLFFVISEYIFISRKLPIRNWTKEVNVDFVKRQSMVERVLCKKFCMKLVKEFRSRLRNANYVERSLERLVLTQNVEDADIKQNLFTNIC
jgi:hypothetical protein